MDLSYSDNDHHILHLDNTPNDAHVSNDNHHKMDISVAADQSQDDFVMGQISEFTNINEESTSNVNQDDDLDWQVCNNDSNSIDSQALLISGQSLNPTHIESNFFNFFAAFKITD